MSGEADVEVTAREKLEEREEMVAAMENRRSHEEGEDEETEYGYERGAYQSPERLWHPIP